MAPWMLSYKCFCLLLAAIDFFSCYWCLC